MHIIIFLHEFGVVHLVLVRGDRTADLAVTAPRDKVLLVARDVVRRFGHDVRSNADVALRARVRALVSVTRVAQRMARSVKAQIQAIPENLGGSEVVEKP